MYLLVRPARFRPSIKRSGTSEFMISPMKQQLDQQLESEVRAIGAQLSHTFRAIVDANDGLESGPQKLSEALGLDKVLVSRILKALRKEEVIDQLHHMPGPAPLRRFLKASKRKFTLAPEVSRDAETAIEDFEALLNDRIGDRSALTSLLTAWSLEVRAEFELRRKQAAWRAMSELFGSTADLTVSTVLLTPAEVPDRLDVTWVLSFCGLRRLRPGVDVTVTTRRTVQESSLRRPEDLDGNVLGDTVGDRLDQFCSGPAVSMNVNSFGELRQYTLEGDAYGPNTAVDLLFAEVNRAEMSSHVAPGSGRRGWVCTDASIPARALVFDILVHEDLYPGEDPELILFNPCTGEGLDLNDPASERHRIDLLETIQRIEPTEEHLKVAGFPTYPGAIAHVLDKLACDAKALRVYRVAIDYPLFGMQVAVAFKAPERS